MTASPLEVIGFETGPLQENAWLVIDRGTGHAALADPGDEGERLIAAVHEAGVTLREIWLTHAHFDHIGAVRAVREHFDVPVFLHEGDVAMFEAGAFQAASWGLPFEPDEVPRHRLTDGQGLTLGGLSFQVMHTPGHSPGHVTIHGEGIAIVGDCLFAGSVGRTDLPMGSASDLRDSLRRIVALPPETRVLPGHGPATTVGIELRTNSFLLDLNAGTR